VCVCVCARAHGVCAHGVCVVRAWVLECIDVANVLLQ